MPQPPRRPKDRAADERDPMLSGMILDAEVLDAHVLDAEVLDADVLDADVLDAAVIDGGVIEGEILDAEPLALDDDPPAVFDLDALDGPPLAATTPAPSLPVYESLPSAPTGADLLALDADRLPPASRTTERPATAVRPAVRITFVCPGEASPFDPRG